MMTWPESVLAASCLCCHVVKPSYSTIALVSGALLAKNSAIVLDTVGGQGIALSVLGKVFTGLGAVFIALQVARPFLNKSLAPPRWSGPGRPLLFPATTTHSRLFPKKHSFSYSYLVVGIPVGWAGAAGGMVSSEVTGPSRWWSSWLSLGPGREKAWFDVDAADYLERGGGHLGLRGKLDAYLMSQGIDPARYPYAYLVTAAKFLGYHFNPVSFWYLYDPDKSLAAMILEVNNTFDERRMYFLLASDSNPKLRVTNANNQPATDQEGTAQAAAPLPLTRIVQTWPKDFHVSPFNSRKGSYSLNAQDVLGPGMAHEAEALDVTIVLRSSKAHGKLVAKIFSDGPAVDPTRMSLWQKLVFLTRWWWVGFVTFPRIVKEAGMLFFSRKLHVWFRPEPLKQSMGRPADDTERQLEAVFRRYLRHLVEQSTFPLAVKYLPGGMSDSSYKGELMLSASAASGEEGTEEVELKVLTPVFYSRFVHYAHDLEALFCELRESHTIWVSAPELLPKLVLKKPPPPLEAAGYGDYVSFGLIRRLRRRPERIERPLTSSETASVQAKAVAVEDIRDFRISSMDGFVLSLGDARMKETYKDAVFRLFLADRLALGLVPLLQAQQFVLRMGTTWLLASFLDPVVKASCGILW